MLMSPPKREVKIPSPRDFPQLCGEDSDLPTCLGSGLRVLTFSPELCLLAENPGRAYRHCLARGTWQTLKNSTDIWQDDSECSENYSFKENVSPLGSVITCPRTETTLCHGWLALEATQKAFPQLACPRLTQGRSSVTRNSTPCGSC